MSNFSESVSAAALNNEPLGRCASADGSKTADLDVSQQSPDSAPNGGQTPRTEIQQLAHSIAARTTGPIGFDMAVLRDLIDELVDALPKTADNVPIVPGMRVWKCFYPEDPVGGTAASVGKYVDIDGRGIHPIALFSSKSAALVETAEECERQVVAKMEFARELRRKARAKGAE